MIFYLKYNVNWCKFVKYPRFAKGNTSIISLSLKKYNLIKFKFYSNFNINWFKFCNDLIFTNADILIISLSLKKYQKIIKIYTLPKKQY